MKNLVSRLNKLEKKKGAAFILFTHPFGCPEVEIEHLRKKAEEKYLNEGGDPSSLKSFVSIVDFSGNEQNRFKWFCA